MLGLVLTLSLTQAVSPESTANHLARAVDLYATYLGEWPSSLEDLIRKPASARFWPDTGFWIGELPKNARFKDGKVLCGGASVPVNPAPGSPIVPPTDRLRRYYSACVGLKLLRAAAQAHLEARGELPSSLPGSKDPWGKPYVVQVLKGRLRLSVEGALEHQQLLGRLTPEEERGLNEGAVLRPSDEARRAIAASIAKLRDDDLETRDEGLAGLEKYPAFSRAPLLEALRVEKDYENRQRLTRALARFPDLEPAWRTELRPLSILLLARKLPAVDNSCMNNLSQLWKMQCVYMSQFGGRMKLMPRETGKDFWLKLSKTTPPLIDEANWDIFLCPASGAEAKGGACSYAGPASDVSKLGEGDVVGLCDDEGHGDVILVLRKSGDVSEAPRGGPEHDQASKGTRR